MDPRGRDRCWGRLPRTFAITRHRQNAIERIAEIVLYHGGEVDEDTLRTELER